MPDINKISVEFTYNVPDDYLAQTNDLEKTHTWTYNGPDKLWIFVDNATGKIPARYYLHEGDDGHDIHAPEGFTKVLIDSATDPIMASMIYHDHDDDTLWTQIEITNPDGSIFLQFDPIPPNHAYELPEIQYDFEKQEFKKPYPWKQPHITWTDMIRWRNNQLHTTDEIYNNCPAEDKAAWKSYRQWLRNLPEIYKGLGAWRVVPPALPVQQPQQGT